MKKILQADNLSKIEQCFVFCILFFYSYAIVCGVRNLELAFEIYSIWGEISEEYFVFAGFQFTGALVHSAVLWYIQSITDMKRTKAELLASLMDASNTISLLTDVPGSLQSHNMLIETNNFARKQLEAINKIIVKHEYGIKAADK